MSTIGDLTSDAPSGRHAPTEANAPHAEIRGEDRSQRLVAGGQQLPKKPCCFPKEVHHLPVGNQNGAAKNRSSTRDAGVDGP